MGKRAERQAVADRRIAGHQEQLAAARVPLLRPPAPARRLGLPALHRQHVARRVGQAALEDARHARPLFRVLELRVRRIDIVRKLAFLEQPLAGVFVDGGDSIGLHSERRGNLRQKLLRIARAGADIGRLGGQQLRRRTTAACRPCANRARRSSAAASRPDTICPGRNEEGRRARNAPAAGGSACRPFRVWSGRLQRCSIRPTS